MLTWNIKNQILFTGLISLVVFVGAIAYFYSFANGEFRNNTENVISMANSQYAQNLQRMFQAQTDRFDSWTREDVYGMALEFNTTSELATEFKNRLNDAPEFAALVLTDQSGRVVEMAVSPQLGSQSASQKGTSLEDMGALSRSGERGASFITSRLLSRIGSSYPETYVYHQATYNTSGVQNGTLLAYSSWQPIGDEVKACNDYLAAHGYAGSTTALAFPKDEQVVALYDPSGRTEARSLMKSVLAGSTSEGNARVTLMDTPEGSAFVGQNPVTPPRADLFQEGSRRDAGPFERHLRIHGHGAIEP